MTAGSGRGDEPLVLGRYRLHQRIAVGGTAEVWRGHDEQLDRPVAIKRLHPHLLPDPTSRARLAAEARAAARLSHPVIVGIYDVDVDGDLPALVMELVRGESLAARIERDGPLPPADAARMGADVADGLYHAHQQGVIHRDVKPGNVLVEADGRARLVDFGIAHSLAAAAERLTLTGTVVGTLSAMSPEQLADGPITPRTDLYGLGVVLHEALTGRRPYPAGSPVALAEAQRVGPPDMPEVDPELAEIVRSCLAHDPALRPLHAGALASSLRAWASEAPTAIRRPAVRAAAPLPAGAPAATGEGADTSAVTQPHGSPARPVRRRTGSVRAALLALAGLALVVVLGAVVLAGFGGRDASGEVPPTPTPPAPSAAVPTDSPSPPPWLAELVGKIAEECGPEAAADVEAELAAVTEDLAKDAADRLVEACKDANRGEGNGNGGRGGGNGNGNGGRGGDD